MKTDSDLTTEAREIARNLTYNDDPAQAAAKAMLLEMAHRIDARNIIVSGNAVVNRLGKNRRLTFKERLLWKLFKVKPVRV